MCAWSASAPLRANRLGAVVVDDLVVVELDARLHHGGDDARPRFRQPLRREHRAVGLDRGDRRLESRHLQLGQILGRAAEHRHLGADDIDARLTADASLRGLGDADQARGAAGDGVLRQGTGSSAHDMEQSAWMLAEAGGHVLLDQHLGLLHGLLGGQTGPRIGAQMVPAQQNALARQADLVGEAVDEVAEHLGRHTGIAAVLIDLVAGRLDQHHAHIGLQRVDESRLDDQRMGRTDRIYAASLAGLVPGDQIEHRLHGNPSVIRKQP